MRTFAKSSSFAVLFAFLAGYHLPMLTAAEDIPSDNMATVVNIVTIAGPLLVVFDLVTTARLWPQWHPVSLTVGGVTERPYRLGDDIQERGLIETQGFHIVWKVVEHQLPSRGVLQSEAPLVRIFYTFESREGKMIFTRTLQYPRKKRPAEGPSQEGVKQLLQVQVSTGSRA